MIFGAAAQLDGPQVLMLNKAQDEFFPAEDAHVFFSAIPGQRKRLVFWDGPNPSRITRATTVRGWI